MSNPIKIFAMNDYDWMAAENLESAKAEYLNNFSGGLDEDEEIHNPCVISDEDMDLLDYIEDDGSLVTFRHKLASMISGGVKFPAFFASENY